MRLPSTLIFQITLVFIAFNCASIQMLGGVTLSYILGNFRKVAGFSTVPCCTASVRIAGCQQSAVHAGTVAVTSNKSNPNNMTCFFIYSLPSNNGV
jgi:hypothetical protein